MYFASERQYFLLFAATLSFQIFRTVLSTTTAIAASSFFFIISILLRGKCSTTRGRVPLVVLHFSLTTSSGSLLCRVKLRRSVAHCFPPQHLFSSQLQLRQQKALHLVVPTERSFVLKPLHTRIFCAQLKPSSSDIFPRTCYHQVHGFPRKRLW